MSAFEWLVGRFVSEFKLLAGGEADHARQTSASGSRSRFWPGSAAAGGFSVPLGREDRQWRETSSFHLIGGLIVKSLRSFTCAATFRCARRRRSPANNVANCEDHQIARILGRILRGLQILRGGVSIVDGVEIEQALSEVSARVIITKRPDDSGNGHAGNRAESEFREIHLRTVRVAGGSDIRKERT